MYLKICSEGGIVNGKKYWRINIIAYLTSWEEDGYVADENGMPKETKIKTCWKGYSFDIINKLMDEKYLYFSKYKNKSVSLTPEGEELAKKLIDKYIK